MFTTAPGANPGRNPHKELADGIRRGCALSKPTRLRGQAYYKFTEANGEVRTCVLGAACIGLGLMKGRQIDLTALRQRFDLSLLHEIESQYEQSYFRFNKRERIANWLEKMGV